MYLDSFIESHGFKSMYSDITHLVSSIDPASSYLGIFLQLALVF